MFVTQAYKRDPAFILTQRLFEEIRYNNRKFYSHLNKPYSHSRKRLGPCPSSILLLYHLVHRSLIISISDGLAVDWVNNRLYFTDEVVDIVGVYDLNTLNATILIRTGTGTRPRAIVLDPYAK